jgi:hypothetical protein
MIFTQFITERKKSELRIEHLNRVYEVRSDINQAITREKDTRTLLERVCGVAVETGRFSHGLDRHARRHGPVPDPRRRGCRNRSRHGSCSRPSAAR